jgi:alanyl-tRNA synthetase
VELLLQRNPFYVESGGQVSDVGTVVGGGWNLVIDQVTKAERGTVVSGSWTDGAFDDCVP